MCVCVRVIQLYGTATGDFLPLQVLYLDIVEGQAKAMSMADSFEHIELRSSHSLSLVSHERVTHYSNTTVCPASMTDFSAAETFKYGNR